MMSVPSALRQREFKTARAFLDSNPGISYVVAAERLKIAPIALIHQAREESRRDGAEDWFLRDCLVREMLEVCVEGWRTGATGDFDAADALGSWVALVSPLGEPWTARARTAGDALFRSMDVPPGWRPVDVKDAFIDQALRSAYTDSTSIWSGLPKNSSEPGLWPPDGVPR